MIKENNLKLVKTTGYKMLTQNYIICSPEIYSYHKKMRRKKYIYLSWYLKKQKNKQIMKIILELNKKQTFKFKCKKRERKKRIFRYLVLHTEFLNIYIYILFLNLSSSISLLYIYTAKR